MNHSLFTHKIIRNITISKSVKSLPQNLKEKKLTVTQMHMRQY